VKLTIFFENTILKRNYVLLTFKAKAVPYKDSFLLVGGGDNGQAGESYR